jgi:branched-chain amino acid transport system substrate-binding protein
MNFIKSAGKLSFIFFLICLSFLICKTVTAKEPVKIAVISSETGMAVEYGRPMIQGAKIAVDEINRQGGLLGRLVELIFIDNKSTALGSKFAAMEAVKLKVTGVIGAAWSSHSLAMAPILQNAKIPMITPGSTNPQVTRIGDYIFRVCFTDELQGKIMAKFARRDLKARTAAVLQNINEQYSLTLADSFISWFEKNDGKVLFRGNYTGKSIDFSGILANVKQIQPDVVFIPGYTRDSALAVKQGKNMGITATFLGGDGWETKMFDYAGDALNNSYATVIWHKDLPNIISQHVKKLFRKKYNNKSIYNAFIPMTYDAVGLFADAVRKTQTLDREKIKDTLAKTVDFPGATGTITFDGTGDPIGKEVIIIKFDNQTSTFVKSVKEETIKIAAIFALTGRAVKSYKASLNGLINAISEINSSGGILDKKVELHIIDNQSTPIGSKIAADKAVAKKVSAIIGPVWSSHAIAAAKVAQKHGIPMICGTATNPKVTEIGDFIFRVCFVDDFQGQVMGIFAVKELNAASAVIFTDITSDYSLGLSKEFQKTFEQLNGKVLFSALYKPELKNYAKLIAHVKKNNPDVIFFSGHDESGFLAKQIQHAGLRAISLGGDSLGSENFLTMGGEDIKQGYYCTHWSENFESPASLAYVKKYSSLINITSAVALSHDAVFLLADAIGRAQSLNKIKIRNAIQNTTSFNGITGNIIFNEMRNPVKDAVINEISNGKISYYKTVKPDNI